MIHEIIKYGLLGIGGTIVSSYIIEAQMKNYDTVIEPPVDTVSIIMPSYNEELFIEEACKSIRNQSIIKQYPEFFEFILVDSGSTDRTVELARQFVDKVIIAGRGKLTARNLATDATKGNIIVAVDGDSIYSKHWLNALLKPFRNTETIATCGSVLDYSVYQFYGPIHTIVDYINYGILRWSGLNGGNSAYRKSAFYKIGKFDTNINQLDFIEVSRVEELEFYDKLSKLGKIEFVLNAVKEHKGGERVACRIGIQPKDGCKNIGIGINRF